MVCMQFSFYPATIKFPCQTEFSPGNTSCSLCKHRELVGCCGWPHQKRKFRLVGSSPADCGCAAVASLSLCVPVCCVKICGLAYYARSECGAQFLAVVQTGYRMGIP